MRRHLFILIGGALGAVARWELSGILAPHAAFPVGIFVVNLTGCLALGFLQTYAMESQWSPELRLGVTTGFLGAYTTFSTWQEGVMLLGRHGDPGLAAFYLLVSLVGGLGMAAVGMAGARRLLAGRPADVAR